MKDQYKLSIFVSSPKSYSDVFDIWYKCQSKFWPNCIYPIIKATDIDFQKYQKIDVIASDKENDGWIDRSIPVLEKIQSKYILLMCDDIFIVDYFDHREIENILDFMDSNSINFCRLSSSKRGKKVQKNIRYIPLRMPYAKNLQFGIFNREFLLREINYLNETAWNVENRWNQEAFMSSRGYYSDVIGINKPIIKYVHGINKSKWYPSAIKKIESLGFEIDSKRKVMSKRTERRMNFICNVGLYITPRARFKIKKILKKIGITFHTEY